MDTGFHGYGRGHRTVALGEMSPIFSDYVAGFPLRFPSTTDYFARLPLPYALPIIGGKGEIRGKGEKRTKKKKKTYPKGILGEDIATIRGATIFYLFSKSIGISEEKKILYIEVFSYLESFLRLREVPLLAKEIGRKRREGERGRRRRKKKEENEKTRKRNPEN